MEKIVSQIIAVMEEQLKTKPRILVAIDGSCTSGKTTLAAKLAEQLDCNVFHMDEFFLRTRQRSEERLVQPGGNVDYERFQEEVLAPLLAGKAVTYRPYDCGTGLLAAPVTVQPKPVTVIEGSYSHHPFFGDCYDLRIFLTVSPEVREARIRQRPAFLQKRFFEEWIPMEQRYFQTFSIPENSHLVLTPQDN